MLLLAAGTGFGMQSHPSLGGPCSHAIHSTVVMAAADCQHLWRKGAGYIRQQHTAAYLQ
jgi:hypothetical protein